MFVADIRRFLDLPDDVPGPARRIAEHLSFLVRAATTTETGRRWVTAIPCQRRPRNRPPRIEWACTTCADEGVISGWEHAPFDLATATWTPPPNRDCP